MGLDPSLVSARARRAYETARVQRAAMLALPLAVFTLLAVRAGTPPTVACGLGALLVVVVGVFLWRGQSAGRAVLPGIVAGLIPFALAWAARSSGHLCMGGQCTSMCLAACTLGGLLGGALLSLYAHQRRASAGLLAYAFGLSLLTGTLGCARLGLSGLLGLGLGLAVSMGLTAWSRRALDGG